MSYLLPDKVYNVLKWVGVLFLPALAAFIGKVGPAWGMPNVDAVVLTINSLGTFIGTVICVSQVSATLGGGSGIDPDDTAELGRHSGGSNA